MAFVDGMEGARAHETPMGDALSGLEPLAVEAPGLRVPAAGVATCLLVIVGGLIYAGASGTFLGGWTFWAGLGAAIVALFGVLGAIALQGEQASRKVVEAGTYSEAFRMLPDPVLITRDGAPVEANAAYYDLSERVGVAGQSGAPPSLDRLFAGSAGDDTAAALYRLLSTGVGTETVRVLDENGELRSFALDVTRLGGGSRLWRVRDVTGPEPLAQSLAEAPVGLASVDGQGRLVATNGTLDRWIGDDSVPATLADFVADADALLDAPREAGRTTRFDTELVTSKGVSTPIVASIRWSELDDGTQVGALALFGHSNLGGVVEAAPPVPAATQGVQVGDTFMSAPFAILELDSRTLSEARVRRANPAFGELTGRVGEDVRFGDIFEAVDGAPPAFLDLEGGECEPREAHDASIMGADGKPLSVNVYIVCHPRMDDLCWAYIVDVSQRTSLQEQLVQSQKMQAIGQLAAGVAHDFNNLLTAIRLNTDELLNRHPVGDPSYPELQRVNSNVMRAAALVKKLLAFSRKQTLRTEVLDVTGTLSDVSVTLRQTLSERVQLEIVHGRDLPPIRADKSQLETVLINLCVNARDAMSDPETGRGGGTITLRSSPVRAEGLPLKDAHEGAAVLIEVSDTGTGMPPEVMAKIFEPFFTTKPQGKGTGLGLATVYGIVQQSGGHLDVESVPGEGTTFRIYLPATDPARAEVVEDAPDAPRAPSNLSGQGTILFVEDEESVRTIAAKTLRKRGYNVVEAGDGEEAYEWLEEGGEPDLLISDVVMPGMDGPTLLKKGRTLLGEARIVFISGYAREEFSDLLAEEPDVTFLPKPFTLAQLAEKVKAEIGEAG